MGVWIETRQEMESMILIMSHPVWVCGLKLRNTCHLYYRQNVTPCMGVWIETCS